MDYTVFLIFELILIEFRDIYWTIIICQNVDEGVEKGLQGSHPSHLGGL